MTNIRTQRRSSGFTLVELLVVIAIIAVLLALTAGAVFRVLNSQTQSATEATLKKLQSGLTQQSTAVKDAARQTFIAGSVDGNYSTANRDAARDNYIAAVMRLEFPVSLAEVTSPVPFGLPAPSGTLPPKPKYVQTINQATGANAAEQGSVCLYMALMQGRRGMEFKLEEAVGASSIRTVGTANYIADAWGSPIILSRAGNDPTKPIAVSAGADRVFGTSDDIRSDQLN